MPQRGVTIGGLVVPALGLIHERQELLHLGEGGDLEPHPRRDVAAPRPAAAHLDLGEAEARVTFPILESPDPGALLDGGGQVGVRETLLVAVTPRYPP